jgi:hypothetical protein
MLLTFIASDMLLDNLELSVLLLATLHKLEYASLPDRIHTYDCNVTIDEFGCVGYYRSTFGFLRKDLHRLKASLLIPERIQLNNGSVFTGEAVLLFSLYRYKSCDDILRMISKFGRDPTQLTRCFQWFNTYMLNRWGYKLKNNLPLLLLL